MKYINFLQPGGGSEEISFMAVLRALSLYLALLYSIFEFKSLDSVHILQELTAFAKHLTSEINIYDFVEFAEDILAFNIVYSKILVVM